jgi:hypothetical protein
MKSVAIFIFIFLSPQSWALEKREVLRAICTLVMDTLTPNQKLADQRFWMGHAMTAIEYNVTRIYVDGAKGVPPQFNQKYYKDRKDLLTSTRQKAKKSNYYDVTQYIITLMSPKPNESVLDYLVAIAAKTSEVFFSVNNDADIALLTAVNSTLNSFTTFSSDLVILLVSELEVLHPKDYENLKDATDFRILSRLRTEISRIGLEIDNLKLATAVPMRAQLREVEHYRNSLAANYQSLRATLYSRLLKKKATDELLTAMAIFGPEEDLP